MHLLLIAMRGIEPSPFFSLYFFPWEPMQRALVGDAGEMRQKRCNRIYYHYRLTNSGQGYDLIPPPPFQSDSIHPDPVPIFFLSSFLIIPCIINQISGTFPSFINSSPMPKATNLF